MSKQALIDGSKFAREAKRLEGTLAVAELPRLAEELFDSSGDVAYRLTGFVDREGKPGIDVEVKGLLTLRCERCLEALSYELLRSARLMLAAAGEELPPVETEATDTETVPEASVANVVDLVEQEVLLGLPLVPAHAEGTCRIPAEQEEKEQADNPFRVLAQLKTSGKSEER